MKKALLFICLLLLTSCATQEDKFVVGVIVPLTGPVADVGQDFYNGMLLAMEEINPNIILEVQDSAMNPTIGLSAAQQLIKTKDIDVLISVGSVVSVPLIRVAEENKIPLIASVVANNDFAKQSPYAFRFFARADADTKVAADFLEKKGITKLAIIHLEDPYGSSMAEHIQKQFDGEIIAIEKFDGASLDFKTQLLKIKEKNPEFIYTAAFPHQNIIMVKQRKELGMEDIPIMGNVALMSTIVLQKLEGYGDNFYGTTFLGHDRSIPKTKEFMDKYESKFGIKSDYVATFGYGMVSILDTVQKSDKDLLTALNELEIEGINGVISFDENGDALPQQIVLKAENDQFVPAE